MPCDDDCVSSDPAPPSTPEQKIEKSSTTLSMGSYPKLSTFMGSLPDVAIFRRFGTLNAQNLLFLQAELSHLERELEVIREREAQSEDEEKQMALRSWWSLSTASENDPDNEQWQVIQDIRAKLVEYNAAVLQYKEICSTHGPSKHDLNVLREWLIRPKCGDNFLQGVEREIWHSQQPHHVSDLVTMAKVQAEKDPFSQWLADNLLGHFHRLIGYRFTKPYDEESGLYHYRESNLKVISHLIGVILASLIPAASIFTLYFVTHMIARLGIILAYSALFSISLAVFTTARRVEIFGATAAYALFLSLIVVLLLPISISI